MQKKGKITDDQLKEFMAKHFEGPGEETELWEPADWVQKYVSLILQKWKSFNGLLT